MKELLFGVLGARRIGDFSTLTFNIMYYSDTQLAAAELALKTLLQRESYTNNTSA